MSSGTIQVELKELSLVSIKPIPVHDDGGGTYYYDVAIAASGHAKSAYTGIPIDTCLARPNY
jgi:hypothetical protein